MRNPVIRVSTFDLNPERQLDGIQIDRAFVDKASGGSCRLSWSAAC